MPSPERWRVWVAVVTASLALPFLVLDNANSASTGPGDEVVASFALQPAPVVDSDVLALSRRAGEWTADRAALVEDNVDLALELAAQSRAVLEAEALAAAGDQRAAEEAAAAEAARLAEEAEARERAEREAAAREAAEREAAVAATTTTAPPPPPTTAAPRPPATSRPEPSAEQWASLRACESSGNYQAVSASGRFRGAYQFSQATWDWVAGTAAPGLVGTDPAAAAPGDQDLMARTLYGMRGAGQWPTCGYLLTS